MSEPTKHNHYYKSVAHLDYIDVYRILQLFPTGSAAIDHAVKKLLLPGQRGGKGYVKDLREAMDSIQRAIDMYEEEQKVDDPKVKESIADLYKVPSTPDGQVDYAHMHKDTTIPIDVHQAQATDYSTTYCSTSDSSSSSDSSCY